MKIVFIIACLVLALYSISFAGDKYVRGHYKDTNHDGVKDTYVQPYHRSEANESRYDNYSTRGNVNPYTNEPGTVNPYQQQNPYTNHNNRYYNNDNN